MSEKKSELKKISFYSKNSLECPVCGSSFYKEELLSGGGRMNAGELTDELHRIFIPTKKFGDVYPLIYPIAVCPECLYSAYITDFGNISSESSHMLELKTQERKNEAKNLFPRANFTQHRGLSEGILSYILAIMCYDDIESKHQPIFKQALSALRAAWLCNDAHNKDKDENYDYLRDILYRKAEFFYSEVIVAESDGREFYEEVPHFGPDLDHNNGFDGVLFLSGLLQFKYGPKENKNRRLETLNVAKINISRIVGMGKASRAKTSDFVENARELHTWIKDELNKLEEEDR